MRASIVIFLFLSTGINAQLDYRTVDSVSYALYSQKQWKQLAEFGDNAADKGFNYYYLNLRLGIANYELGHFYTAERFFKNAWKKNNAGKVAPEYLFWIYYQTGREPEAAAMYDLLPDSVKLITDYNPRGFFESVYLEGGSKLSNHTDVAGNLLYGSIGIKHHFSPKFNLYHGYAYMGNELTWGKYRQHQYYIAPTFNLKKGWQIGLGLNYFRYESNINYAYETQEILIRTIDNGLSNDTSMITRHLNKGDYTLNAHYGQINISKTYHGVSIKPQIGWYGELHESDLLDISNTDTVVTVSQFGQQISSEIIGSHIDTFQIVTENTSQLQCGIGLDYTHRLHKIASLTIGVELHTVWTEESSAFVFAPYFRAVISKSFGISGYYASKENHPLSLFGGATVINNYDKLNHRISLTGRYDLSNSVTFFPTFQWDDLEDNLSLKQYQSYSILIGLKIKF